MGLNLNQEKIKRLTNKIKNLANKIYECQDEIDRYQKRYGATHEQLKHYFNQVKRKKMRPEAFRAKTGYVPSAVEAAIENMGEVVDRLDRIQKTVPIPIDKFLELNEKIVNLEDTILSDVEMAAARSAEVSRNVTIEELGASVVVAVKKCHELRRGGIEAGQHGRHLTAVGLAADEPEPRIAKLGQAGRNSPRRSIGRQIVDHDAFEIPEGLAGDGPDCLLDERGLVEIADNDRSKRPPCSEESAFELRLTHVGRSLSQAIEGNRTMSSSRMIAWASRTVARIHVQVLRASRLAQASA